MYKYLCFVITFLPFAYNADAQNDFSFQIVNKHHAILTFNSSGVSNREYIIQPKDFNFTSLKVELAQNPELPVSIQFKNFNGNPLSQTLNFDSEFSGPDSMLPFSGFYIFNSSMDRVGINLASYTGLVSIHLMYAPNLKSDNLNSLHKRSSGCDKPSMISYQVWRQGLPDPKPPRETTKTEHLVVHHSAGNNGDTNYLNIVRNIYLLHTQSNGWDDIGYNYLIAGDGTIFMGRDPQGAGDEDNILGAHFCGKNTNTMGICLLGNFMTVSPEPKTLFSLKYLLAWKLKKEKINALGQTVHPQPNGNLLNNVCGHRDGCNTSCPGDSLYILLDKLKREAARIADSCGLILVKTNEVMSTGSLVFPNPNSGNFTIITQQNELESEVFIYTINGNLIFNTKFISGQNFELFLPQGLYYYLIKQKNQNTTPGKLLIKTK